MCKNSSFHRNSTNSTLFKSWWQQLYLTKIPNSGFSRFLRKSLIKNFHGNFPIQLEKVPNFFYKIERNFFSEYFWNKFFTFLESLNLPLSRKYKMPSTFFHFGEKSLLKNVPLKQNNTFPNHWQLKNNLFLLKTNFFIIIFSWNGFQMLFFVP